MPYGVSITYRKKQKRNYADKNPHTFAKRSGKTCVECSTGISLKEVMSTPEGQDFLCDTCRIETRRRSKIFPQPAYA